MKRVIKEMSQLLADGYSFNSRGDLVNKSDEIFLSKAMFMFCGKEVAVKQDGLTVTEGLRPMKLDDACFDGEAVDEVVWEEVKIFMSSEGLVEYRNLNGKTMEKIQ